MNRRYDHKSGGGRGSIDEQTLAAYIEGTLSDAERVRVEAALAEDDEALRGLVSARHLLAEVARDPVEAPDYAKVRAKNLARTGFKIQPAGENASDPGVFAKLAAFFTGPRLGLAGLAVGAGLAFVMLRGGPVTDTGEVVRGGTETHAAATIGLAAGEAGSVSWAPVESTGRYVVRVYDAEGMIAWRSEVSEASVTIPATVFGDFTPGTEYTVEVEAIRPFDGNERFTAAKLTIDE